MSQRIKCRTIVDDDNKYEQGNSYTKAVSAQRVSNINKRLFSSEQIRIGEQVYRKFTSSFRSKVFHDYTKNSIKFKIAFPSIKEMNSPAVVELLAFCKQAGFSCKERVQHNKVRSLLVHFPRIPK